MTDTLDSLAPRPRRANMPRAGWRPLRASGGSCPHPRAADLPAGSFASRPAAAQRPLCLALALVASCLFAALGVRGADSADSGWTVAKPTTVLDRDTHSDPNLRIAINHFLEQGRMPLLSPAAPATDAGSGTPTTGDRRDDPSMAADGWRPARMADTPSDAAEEPFSERADEPADEPIVGPQFRFSNGPTAPSTVGTTHDLAPRLQSALRQGMRLVDEQLVPDHESKTQIDAEPAATPTDARAADSDNEPAANGKGSASVILPDRQTTESTSAASDETPPAAPQQQQRVDVETTVEREAAPPAAAEPEPEPLPALSRSMQNLRVKVRRVLKSYHNKPLNSRDNDPWEMMHGMLAYGVHSQTRQGGPNGKLITSVGWLCYNQPCKGLTLLYVTPEGSLRAKQGVGLQGHSGQFLAMLAQCRVSPEYPIRVGEREFEIRDLIEAEKKTCYPKTELTFKLIALMHYLDSDATWVNDQGMSWDIPRLIREELAQPIRGAACGGTHRLAGLSLAARTRVRRGEPLDGEYLRAADYVEKYHNYAFQLQNRDGSLSTAWFNRRGEESDVNRRVKTTGHILEWLCYSLSDEQLRSTRTIRAVNYLANLLSSNYRHDWEIGPRSHAIHALKLYDERVFQPYDGREEVVTGPARRQTAAHGQSRAAQR